MRLSKIEWNRVWRKTSKEVVLIRGLNTKYERRHFAKQCAVHLQRYWPMNCRHFVGSASAPSPFKSRFVSCTTTWVQPRPSHSRDKIRSIRPKSSDAFKHFDDTPERIALYNCSSCLSLLLHPANQNKSHSLASEIVTFHRYTVILRHFGLTSVRTGPQLYRERITTTPNFSCQRIDAGTLTRRDGTARGRRCGGAWDDSVARWWV